MGPAALGIRSAVLENQVVINFQCIPRWRLAVCVVGCKLHTECVTNDYMLCAASGWWSPACGIIKAGVKVCCLGLPCLFVMLEY